MPGSTQILLLDSPVPPHANKRGLGPQRTFGHFRRLMTAQVKRCKLSCIAELASERFLYVQRLYPFSSIDIPFQTSTVGLNDATLENEPREATKTRRESVISISRTISSTGSHLRLSLEKQPDSGNGHRRASNGLEYAEIGTPCTPGAEPFEPQDVSDVEVHGLHNGAQIAGSISLDFVYLPTTFKSVGSRFEVRHLNSFRKSHFSSLNLALH